MLLVEKRRGVYELVVGWQGKKKGVSSWLRQGDYQAKETNEKRGTPAHGNE
jgi:hypothetical protein